jgi:large subunit ribosomal protein L29
MRAEEIREMAAQDVETRVRELEEERFRLKFRGATEPLEDPLRLRVLRKDIARLKTVLREQRTKAGARGEPAAAAAKTATKTPAKRAVAKKAAAKKTTKRAAR